MTIKKYLLGAATFLLAGCPGPGDRMAARELATVIVKDDTVCVVSALSVEEQITAVQINSDNGGVLHKTFDHAPVYVAKGKCLPLFGYIFSPGHKYSIAYDVESEKRDYYLTTSEFSTTQTPSGVISILYQSAF